MDKNLLHKLTAFAIIIVVGLIGWQVIANLLAPPKVPANEGVTRVMRGTVNSTLNDDSLALMRQRQDYSESELSQFEIYLEDSVAAANSREDMLFLQYFSPTRPLDLDYLRLQVLLANATASAQATDTVPTPNLDVTVNTNNLGAQ